ncbi:Holliday junction branch migration protein RuvA [Weissella paramesenteroides]|jgi:Holliday junction DNA helicase RuvA|uniref:Holliday junction branch migration complex subunit RuvA n=1 Tax=Weissella paramesenteroides TaxID=1249 RepID=A0A5M9ER81_WEIPA|nr:Holliday junction branch migration protein RuvA [Weissella paramesenteroides]KAA8439229.1 Holliday junction branch migration protein RuvA [Weissella paramesenteroides]KAA8439552.1 Holliday junction branch migration protein RuvA [Weissella paramesenteroides]KAA8444026.1 Holliday junction branch migration protein RuvA [Weissella paramesenteroides]KAA8445116.1 Holliday junction branch migration protein RuvA [Weissella paramesenteroides]KAA8446507.1 Holliday junction branch migration protein Ru
MYEYLKGTITAILPSYIVIDIQGVGYRVLVANPYAFSLNSTMTVYVEQIIRDNDQNLYGFLTKEDKDLFQKLLNVSGIGPKSALAILANSDHTGLINAITQNDIGFLTKFPGIGKKTAQQIVLDLQNKLSDLTLSIDDSNVSVQEEATDSELADALLALEALGYAKKDIKRVEKELTKQTNLTTAAYVSSGLRLLQ